MRQKPALTASDAAHLVAAASAEAARHNWNVAIAIVDDGGFLIRLERLDGAGPQTAEIATLKARSAALSRMPTKRLEDVTKDRPGMLGMPNRLAVQGGLPIVHAGECVGGIGVSGVQSHEDEVVAAAALAAFAAL